MQQLPTLLGLQCIVGRIQTIRLCKPFVMRMRGSNIVGRAVKTDTTVCCATFWRSRNKRNVRILIFLLYPSACTTLPTKLGSWLNSLTGFQPFPNTPNNSNMQQQVCKRTQPVTSNNVGSYLPTILRPFARGLTRVTSLLLFQVLGCHIVWTHGRTVSFSMLWRTSDEGYVYSDHYKTGAVQSAF